MKAIKIINQDDNRTIGIFQDNNGEYLAMTYASSKRFKTLQGAKNWLSKKGYN